MCHHVHDITGETAGAQPVVAIAAASGDDGHFVHLAQWLGDGADDLRHAREQFIKYSRLIVFMERSRFDLHGIGFSFTFSSDYLSLRQPSSANYLGFRQTASSIGISVTKTFCLGGIGLPLRLEDQALALGFCDSLNAPALGFSSFLDRCLQFQFTALYFGLLHFNLRAFLNFGHFHRFGNDLLLHQIRLNIIGLISGSLLLLHFGIKRGFFQGQVTL